MSDKNHTTKLQFFNRLFYSLFIVFTVFMLLYNILAHGSGSVYGGESLDYSDLWSYESGSIVDFDNLKSDEHFEIRRRTNGEIINTKDLCFYSKNIYFTVYLNDEVIYDFHPQPPKLFGKAYGIFPHAITIPVMSRDGTLYIDIDNIYPEKPGYIKNISLDNGNRFIISELQNSAFEFILCLIGFVFGFILMIIGLIGRHFGEKRFEIISMSTFAMISSLWVVSETSMLSVLSGTPIAVHFADYIALDLIPLPGLLFVISSTGTRKKWPIILCNITTFSVIIYSMISTYTGRADYHQLLWLTHINLSIIAALIIGIIIVSLVKKRLTKRLTIVLLTAIILSLVTGIIDIIRYTVSVPGYASFSYFKLSVFIFISLTGIYEFISISEMSRRGQYAEIMEELAFRDGLTGLLNRLGFNNALDKASRGRHTYTFIMLDMNYLKKVNDELGHTTGDKYIKTIAELIKGSFVNNESCFRIGGDEFFVLADYGMSDPKFKQCMDLLRARIDDFNKENNYSIPLSIAYGATEFEPKRDSVESKIRHADERMYIMKAEMKAERG